jgi:hypothetical protein
MPTSIAVLIPNPQHATRSFSVGMAAPPPDLSLAAQCCAGGVFSAATVALLVSAAGLASAFAPPAAFSCLHEVVENTMAKVAIPKTIHFSRQVFIRVAESVPNGANLRFVWDHFIDRFLVARTMADLDDLILGNIHSLVRLRSTFHSSWFSSE